MGRVPEGKPYTGKTALGYFTSWKTLFFTLIFSKLRLPLRHRHFYTPLGQAARAGAFCMVAKEKVVGKAKVLLRRERPIGPSRTSS